MATNLPSLTSLFIFFISILTTKSQKFTCKTTSCETFGLPIQFPFSLNQSNQTNLCTYPGFELTCSNTTTTFFSEPLLTLSNSEQFVVKRISLKDQTIWVNDPKCLPKHFMFDHHDNNFMLNLKDSPFRLGDYYTFVNFSFLTCPSNSTFLSMVPPISCLNLSTNEKNKNMNYSVVAMMSDAVFATPWVSLCEFISSALIPIEEEGNNWLFWSDYYSDIPLEWDSPDCGNCEARGGRCGLVAEHTLISVACYDLPKQG
jgi:hypothetical protein